MGRREARARACILLALLTTIACGKEGPPLPPLVRLPTPPADLTADRRGSAVDVTLVVPGANTDGSRPANLQRVDVYAYTGPGNLSDEQILKFGTRVGSIEVKAPRDPDATVDADEPLSDVEPPEGPGVDQGSPARLSERLAADAFEEISVARADSKQPPPAPPIVPLAGPLPNPVTRFYAGAGITTRGRPGPLSRRVPVSLAPAPESVPAPSVAYDENAITVSWKPGWTPLPIQEPASGDVLEARPVAYAMPATAYNVYDVTVDPEANGKEVVPVRLTSPATDKTEYVDTRIEWGEERCYAVRVVRAFETLTVESDLSPPTCRQLVDSFAPRAPVNLQAVASEGAINLIWDPNKEADLAGYLVLRSTAASAPAPLTESPIQESTFRDVVAAGTRYVYAVRAVDKAGNTSEPSTATDPAEAR